MLHSQYKHQGNGNKHQINRIGNLKILNSRETKNIVEKIIEQYGCDEEFKKAISGYVFLMNKDNRIYVLSRDIEKIPYDEMKIDSLGMYFGELYKESIRFSIEGSQMVGPFAKRNNIEFSKEQISEWVKGSDIQLTEEEISENDLIDNRDFIIIKNSRDKDEMKKNNSENSFDYYGAGKFKDGKIINFVSKSRKLVTVNE